MVKQRKPPFDSLPLEKPLPESELRIVFGLMRFGPCSATELAGHLSNILPTTVYTLLQRLEAKRLVESESGLRPVTDSPFTLKPSRVWTFRQDRLDEILQVEFDHLLNVRYGDNPVILDRLYTRLRKAKKEVERSPGKARASRKRGSPRSAQRLP